MLRRFFLMACLIAAFGLLADACCAADGATKKIVLIAGPKSHGPTGNGIHDYPWSVKLLKVMLDHSNVREQVRVEYHLDGMPQDLKTLDDADTIMVISDGRDGDLYQDAPHFGSEENLKAVQKQIDRGCGFLTFHFSTFAPDQYARQILDWSGGYFDWETNGKKQWYSAITHKEADVTLGSPDHAVLRGVKPFRMKEEFYFNLRFAPESEPRDGKDGGDQKDEARGVLSPLFVVPALNGREPDGNVVAWAKQRASGGRGFGTTCGHFYSNWEQDNFRKLILNAIAWTAKLEFPAGGVEARYFTHAEITKALAGVEGTQRAEIDEKPIRVLMLSGNEAHKWHNWEKTTPVMKAALEKDPRVKVEVTLDPEDFGKRDIAKNFDVILHNYANWHDPKQLSDGSKTAYMNFVQNGGGVIFVHFGSSLFHFSLPMAGESDWPELRKVVRRVWNHHGKGESQSGHDAFGPFEVRFTELRHPITDGLENFPIVDELYFKQDGPEPFEPLIVANSKVTKRDEPLAAVYTYGKGKIFQTLLGHSEKTYEPFETREMLRRAAAWTAGRRVLKLRAEDDIVEAPKVAAPAAGANPPAAKAQLTLASGKFGSALDARAAGALIDAKPEQRTLPLTVDCWTKLDGKAGFNILVASEAKSSASHWEMYSYAGSGFFSVYLPGCGGEYRSAVAIADGKWHHVAMTLEPKRLRMFVDGKSVLDKPLTQDFPISKSGSLAIGRLVEGGISCAGLIDEFHMRKGALAFEQAPEKAPVVDDNTIGLWRFDELIEKTKLKDESKLQTPAMAELAGTAAPVAATQPAGKPKPPAHWGKEAIGFDQWEGDWVDNRWKESNIGRWLSSVVALPGGSGRKMTSIRVGDQQQATVCFDEQNAQVRAVWTGGFLKFNPARFGIIGAPTPDGGFMVQTPEFAGWAGEKIQYRGMHTHGERVVLSYTVDGVEVRESPWCEQIGDRLVVTRTIEVEPSDKHLQLQLMQKAAGGELHNGELPWLVRREGPVGFWTGVRSASKIEPVVTSTEGGLTGGFRVPASKELRRFKLVYWTGLLTDKAGWEQALALTPAPKPMSEPELKQLQQPGPRKWVEKIETVGKRAADDAPYVVDTFTLPFDNPYKALLFTAGHDFLSNGDILVCTVHGDVWRMSQLPDEKVVKSKPNEMKLRWQRIATGLHQPLGLVVVRPNAKASQKTDDAIYVLCRDQITRLYDNNNDGETDYYECFSNVYPTSAGGHDYITCLERDSDGNFWFVHANQGIVRVSADGQKFDVVSTGLRNPNGMGLGPGNVVTAAPQEGEWTPASAIYVAKPGAHFGGGGPRVTDSRPLGYDAPAVWIPRRVDNSSGGQAWVTSDKWGPLTGHMLHFSFGQCSVMLGIDDVAPGGSRGPQHPTQMGLVEFPFRFDSGAMRGRFSPHDGQLYVTGLRGWTSAATTDGCLQRVRYTGQSVDMPVSTTAYSNGVAIKFTDPLDKDVAENPGNFHVEQWNYLYSKTYGSPEYRVSDPKQEGRDGVRVRSATLLDDRTVFLELKDVKPVNVLAVSCALKSAAVNSTSGNKPNAAARNFRRTMYLTLNSVRSDKMDESKLARKTPAGGLNEAQEAELRPGLIARFASAAQARLVEAGRLPYEDARVDRMAATFVSPIHAPSQFLKPGPFVARWEGFIRVPLQQTVTFSVEGQGRATLFINDKELKAPGSAETPAKGVLIAERSATLSGGFNKLALEYASPAESSAAQFRLMWESPEFAREPVPPHVLFHSSEDPGLLAAEQLRRGRELFVSRQCRACHGPASDRFEPLLSEDPLTAPNFSQGVPKADWLESWLRNPHQINPDAAMPALFNGPAEADVKRYLFMLSQRSRVRGGPGPADFLTQKNKELASLGQQLFEDLGCVACHRFTEPSVADPSDRRSLFHVNHKYHLSTLKSFLENPAARHPNTRMPNFQLTDPEIDQLAAFLMMKAADTPQKVDSFEVNSGGVPDPIRQLCIRCHDLRGERRTPLEKPIPMNDLRSPIGCIAAERHQQGGTPWYSLSATDRAALVRFVQSKLTGLDLRVPVEESRRLVKTLRCESCHDRDGAVSPRRALIVEESDSGLVPDVFPSLSLAGEKLHGAWMEQFLKTGTHGLQPAKSPPNATGLKATDLRLRPWLKGRMPSFGHYAYALSRGLAAEHGIDATEEARFTPEPQRAEIGSQLVQKSALDCRQCHAVGNQPAQGDDKTKIAPGINFALVKARLRHDYYQRFTLDPPRFDINTKMPKLAADGKTTKVTTILGGDARQQFDAVWHFINTASFDTAAK